ncbi:MAG: thiamine-phosphate kinase [Saprospiraceae bacterium]|nr:thiamine-phosphate kinase [Saprospiraceae bacterium]
MVRTELSDLGEFGLIEHLTKDVKLINTSSLKGIGDDAAVIDHGSLKTVVSTDLMVEGIHFDLVYTPLKHLGYKAVIVNLSDIYAMNAKPTQITVSIAVSNRFSVEAVNELYSGIHLACQIYGVDLIGGDTTSSIKGLTISITAIGMAAENKLVYRDTANIGDLLCVSGFLGGAYVGLQLLEREKQIYLEDKNMQPDLENKDYIVGRLLKPEARKDVYEFFQKCDLKPTAMIDVSDGLSSDLLHICRQSKVGAFVEEGALPIAQETSLKAMDFKLPPSTCALHGGEDYELLFTVKPKDADKLKYALDIRIIGEITKPEDGIYLHTTGGKRRELIAQGWQHH